jgi:hypothetical protein
MAVNGSCKPEADVTAPAPEIITTAETQPIDEAHHTRRKHAVKPATQVILSADKELGQWRFMPVMSIDQALERRQAIVDATKKLMREGTDYGKIPGTDRDVLLQPGADKLCNLFGLVIQYDVTKCEEDWSGQNHDGVPFFFYELKGRAYRGDFLMGEGVGSCNSWESKYRWRKAERLCPQCGKANIRKSRDGGWFCWLKTDGCGANFVPGDPRIEGQDVGRKVNPDMADCVNTILKMAQKRAKVSTTINATSASEFFTQDMEDQQEAEDPKGLNVDTGSGRYGTREAQVYLQDKKIGELRAAEAANNPKPSAEAPELTGTKSGEIKQAFQVLRERIGEVRYLEELHLAGVTDPLQLRSLDKVRGFYRRLGQIAQLTAERVA